ncbi:MAG: ABC transporter substrate-binding protein [Candidatus Binataceae bacterium]
MNLRGRIPERLRLAAVLIVTSIAVLALAASSCRNTSRDGRALTIALAIFPGEAARYRQFVREFEARRGVRVDIIAQSYNDILQVVTAQAGGGRGTIDIAELDLSMLARARNSALDLGAVVSPEARQLFPQAAWNAAETGGGLRFIPHRLFWQAMIYNRARLPTPPATWTELAEFSRRHPGKLVLKAARYEGLICDLAPFVWGAGGDFLEPTSAGSVRGLFFVAQLAPYLNSYSQVMREMTALDAQARGEVWVHFNWPFAMDYLANKGLAPGVNGSAPIPAGPYGAATPLGGGYLLIPTSAPNRELAEEFLRYLLTPASQENLGRELGWYGSVAPVAGSEQALLYAGFTAMREQVRARPVVPCYAQLSDSWQRAARALLFGNEPPTGAVEQVSRSTALLPVFRGSNEECKCK